MPRAATVDEINRLIDSLDAEGERKPLKAVQKVREAGPRVVAPLMKRFEAAKRPRLRRWIVNALGALGDRRALPLLKRAVRDPHMSVRLHAMEALERFNDPKLAATMLTLLNDESGGIRVRTIDALRRMNSYQSIPALRALASSDEKWYVRQASAVALGELGARQARPELEALRAYPRKAVQQAACAALTRLAAPPRKG
ncbi:MAG: HEAT repeat domain-containing protein [Planctomycetes bacterium]|nr:HEAT repeat domain-containing protein [Planctomycetota bacterium]